MKPNKNKGKYIGIGGKDATSPQTRINLPKNEGSTIIGGIYPGDKNEVVRIFPIYHTLSKNKKTNILNLMKWWIENELTKLPLPPKALKKITKKQKNA